MRTTLHLVAARDFPAINAAVKEARVRNWQPTARRAGVTIEALHRRLLAFCAEPRTVAEMEAFIADTKAGADLARHAPGGVRNVAYRIVSTPGWLVHVPPSGMWDSFAKPRCVDASVWLSDAVEPPPDEGLRVMIERYLSACGPASLEDVAKWLGLSRVTTLRAAVAAIDGRLRRYPGPDGRELIDVAGAPISDGDEPAPPRFLARWDSVLIGYDVRDRILPAAIAPAVMRKNADVLPSFTVDGFVAGTWGIETARDEAVMTITPATKVPRPARTELTEEAERLVRFAAADASRHEVRWE